MSTEALLAYGVGEKHPPEKPDSLRELKWKELVTRMNAYKFYIKLILEVNAFFYATTGAVILFSLKDGSMVGPPSLSTPEIFLLLPILMGTVVGGFMTYAAALQKDNEGIIQGILKDLKENRSMDISRVPDLKLLRKLLLIFGTLFSSSRQH